MLKVLFIGVPDDSIPNHEKLDFGEAVALTHELEMKYREEKKNVSAEFFVISEKIPNLYKGTFDFGSYEYPNIYHQIKKIVPKIKVDKEKQNEKLYLLEQIEELTPEPFKKEENIDHTLINVDKSKISKLKKWQRTAIYAIAALLFAGVSVLSISFIAQKSQYEKALAEGREIVQQNENVIESYEYGLLGEEEEFLTALEAREEYTENQKRILANVYLNKGEYEKAVAILDDTVYAETLIMKNEQLSKDEKIKKIKEFNEIYPTNEARFDLAYFEGNYELMMNLPSINMTIERSRMKTYGLMKLGKIDEAKVELNNNNDDSLKQKIDSFEILTAEITTLEENLDKENKAKEKDKKAISSITEELKKKKEELAAL